MKYEITAMRLREAMEDKHMSAQELANATGIGKSSISHYYNGSHTIGNINAFKIAKVLDVSPMWLMEFDVEKNNKHELYFEISNPNGIDLGRATEELQMDALKFYYKYLQADKKTRKMIDMLLEEGDD